MLGEESNIKKDSAKSIKTLMYCKLIDIYLKYYDWLLIHQLYKILLSGEISRYSNNFICNMS